MENNNRQMKSWIDMDKKPLRFPDAQRAEVDELFAPMDKSVVSSVMVAVTRHRNRVRSGQAVWLGLSPVMAIMLAMMLYVGGALPTPSGQNRSGMIVATSGAGNGAESAVPKDLTQRADSCSLLATVARPQLIIDLKGDPMRLDIVVWWLRTSHPDVAEELVGAGQDDVVAVELQPHEVAAFSSIMSIHGFTGQTTWGLRILHGSAASVWSLALMGSSYVVCFVP